MAVTICKLVFYNMTKRFAYGLIILLLYWAVGESVFAAENCPQQESTCATIEGTGHNVPQWQDIGMCDVLAVTGGSTLTPPPTVRVVHDSPSGTAPTTHESGARHYSVKQLSVCSHHRTISGYIYIIRCLRL